MTTKTKSNRWIPLTLTLLALGASAAVAADGAAKPDPAKVERGKMLVTFGGCNDCHTPFKMGEHGPEPDMTRMLSGHPQQMVMPPAPTLPAGPWIGSIGATFTAWAGPWGTSFTANLTPDADTGLGKWSEADFIATVRNGRHLGRGRELLPPMPWQNVASLSDDDVKAVFAYLQSIPPVKNRVPDPIPPAVAH